MVTRSRPKPSTYEPTAVPTHAAAVDRWLARYAWGSPKTVRNYRECVERRWLTWALSRGLTDLADITTAHIQDWLADEHKRGLAASTFNQRVRTMRTFFNWVKSEDFLDRNPMERLEAPRMPERIRVGYSREELNIILRAASDSPGAIGVRNHAMIVAFLGTGCRADELVSMRAGDFDFANRRMVLHGKGSKDRTIPIGRNVYRALRDWLRERPRFARDPDVVWWTQRGTPFTYDSLNGLMRSLEERTGIALEPHRFRHTFACEFYRAHRDIIGLKSMLGHSKIETTQRYLRGLGLDYASNMKLATPDEWIAGA